MARKPRISKVFLILVTGVAWSLPLPTGSIEIDAGQPAYLASVPPEFEVTAWRELLNVSGHTKSKQHENRLRQAVSAHFPGQSVQFTFRPLGVAPDWWDSATAELIMALAAMDSPGAILHGNSVRIRGVVADGFSAETGLKPLRKAMPDTADFDIQLVEIEPGISARMLCERQFTAIKPGPIEFEESGIQLRSSALPALERIVALADACRDSTVSITGHTDSSGNEDWNRHLSLARANTVAHYLDERGVSPERMLIIGAGSSLPVANNATRYGRGLNRRIEIRLASTD